MKFAISFFSSLVLILITLFTNNSLAQENPKYFWVQTEKVFPGKISEYETAQKEANNFIKGNNMEFFWYAYSTDNHQYLYVTPINSLSDIEKSWTAFSEAEKNINKEDIQNMMNRFIGTVAHMRNEVLSFNKHTYKPKSPRLSPDEIKYFKWHFFDLKPYANSDAEASLAQMKTLFEQNEIPDGYSVFNGALGSNPNLLIIVIGAKNAEDYITHTNYTYKKLGDKGKELLDRLMAVSNDYSVISGWYRNDLSLMPERLDE